MTHLTAGQKAPDFSFDTEKGAQKSLSDFRGRKVILYFYPKDDTPGCTTEACAFNDNLLALNRLNVQVFGVSKDSPAAHRKFAAKYNLTFPLLSDEAGTLCELYGTWVEKSMYGKKYMGIARTTFLIGETGDLLRVWSDVKPDGHVAEILSYLGSANSGWGAGSGRAFA